MSYERKLTSYGEIYFKATCRFLMADDSQDLGHWWQAAIEWLDTTTELMPLDWGESIYTREWFDETHPEIFRKILDRLEKISPERIAKLEIEAIEKGANE